MGRAHRPRAHCDDVESTRLEVTLPYRIGTGTVLALTWLCAPPCGYNPQGRDATVLHYPCTFHTPLSAAGESSVQRALCCTRAHAYTATCLKMTRTLPPGCKTFVRIETNH